MRIYIDTEFQTVELQATDRQDWTAILPMAIDATRRGDQISDAWSSTPEDASCGCDDPDCGVDPPIDEQVVTHDPDCRWNRCEGCGEPQYDDDELDETERSAALNLATEGQWLPGDGERWLEVMREADRFAAAVLTRTLQAHAVSYIEHRARELRTRSISERVPRQSDRELMLGIAAFAMAWLIQDESQYGAS